MTEFRAVKITEGPNPITIIGKVFNNQMHFGVTRCGNNERYDENLGLEIAERRCEVLPYTVISKALTKKSKKDRKQQFELIAESIASHINSAKQWNPNLRRKRNKR